MNKICYKQEENVEWLLKNGVSRQTGSYGQVGSEVTWIYRHVLKCAHRRK